MNKIDYFARDCHISHPERSGLITNTSREKRKRGRVRPIYIAVRRNTRQPRMTRLGRTPKTLTTAADVSVCMEIPSRQAEFMGQKGMGHPIL